VKPALKQLHWLPVEQRITYKLCLFMHYIHIGRGADSMGHGGHVPPKFTNGWARGRHREQNIKQEIAKYFLS